MRAVLIIRQTLEIACSSGGIDRDMPQDDSAAADALIEELVQWLRNEVAPVVRSGANWKAIINGRGAADWTYVVEKHGGRRSCTARTTEAGN